MHSAFTATMVVGSLVLLAAVVGAIHYYLVARERSLVLIDYSALFLFASAIAVLGYIVGTWLGVHLACASIALGNQCGIVGYFGFGPLLAGVLLFAYARTWAQGKHRAP